MSEREVLLYIGVTAAVLVLETVVFLMGGLPLVLIAASLAHLVMSRIETARGLGIAKDGGAG